MRTVPKVVMIIYIAALCAPGYAQSPSSDSVSEAKAKKQTSKQDKAKSEKAKSDTAPAKTAPDSVDETPKPAPIKSKLEPNRNVYLEMGYADWDLRGNESKFRQYATPPRGIFLRDFRFAPNFRSPSEDAFFQLRGIGQDDYLAAGRGVWEYGKTQAKGFLTRSRFFDPSAGSINPSTWQTEALTLRRKLKPDFSISFQARSDSQQLNYQTPQDGLNQNTDFWEAAAAGKLGSGFTRVSFSNFHYADDTGVLQNFDAQKLDLSYLWTPTSAIGIELAGSHVTIHQPDMPESHLETLSLGGDFTLTPATDLAVKLQRRQLGLPTVQNAYARNENSAIFNLSHRFKNWHSQLGFRLQSDERVNGDQTNVDVPKWSTLEGRLSGRLYHNVKLTLRAYTQSLSNPPPSVLSDPQTLYWTNRNYFQARLEGGLLNLNGYLIYTYRVNRNSERASDVTTEQYTLGSNWQINQNVNIFAEYHHENWTGRTDLLDFPSLSNFLPDSDTGVVELNWSLGRQASISLNYTGFAAYNDNPLLLQDGNTHGSFLTINTHYRFPSGCELGIILAPWTYRDTVSSALNYDSTAFMLTGSARF